MKNSLYAVSVEKKVDVMYRRMNRWTSLEDSYLVRGSDLAFQFLLSLAFPFFLLG